ncbi:hypothetical protein SAMN02910356_00798 [Selenomonas sp. GACV-9]|uniref:sporulation-specific protein 15 n=1 Tax=Selenomonas sp. GACV-9 TaxID=3158782 RepID=UPI0008F33645|nr:hypothetical protein SAMN02910356_00798 [Selenomonas ruminantium]
MTDQQINLSPAEAQRMTRNIQALQKRLRDMHAMRDTINRSLARVTADNLSLALTQKKNLKALSSEYDKLTKETGCLDPLDAAQILEEEYNYILTIGNVLETTRELKKTKSLQDNNRDAILDGLLKFYDGLRAELAAAASAETAKQGGAPLR